MAVPLFPQARCSLPSIAAVDFDFVSACDALPPPEPVFDQPDIEIPLDFPPPKVIIPPICLQCPIIAGSATAEVSIGSVPTVDVLVTPLTSAGSCDSQPVCTYLFDFHFRLPQQPCPAIETTAVTTTAIGSSAAVDIAITQIPGSPGHCRYLFDFNFQFPASITIVTHLTDIINTLGNVALYGTATLGEDLCDQVAGVAVDDFSFESPDFSGGAITPPATVDNPFGHRGKSGAMVLIVYWYVSGTWVVIDIERQKKRVYTNLRIKADKTFIEGFAIDVAAECCQDDQWVNLIPLKKCT